MRIWFDILTPKQVLFFRPAINLLKENGHQVLATSRQYREAVELAKLKMLDLTIVGSHGGADRYSKLRASANRVYELAEHVKRFSPDVAVNFSSPEGARIAFGLGIKYIGVNDSPHAEAVARLTVPLMTRLLTPWVIPYSFWTIYGIDKSRISRYHALDPAAWLKGELQDSSTGEETDTDHSRKVLVRLEESKAAYIADKKLSVDSVMLDRLVKGLSGNARVIILCRYADQIEQMKVRYGKSVDVLDKVTNGTELIRSIDVFVGAGGTMTTEAALLGKPTISIAPHRFEVEKYLERVRLASRIDGAGKLLEKVQLYLASEKLRNAQKIRAAKILSSMENPTDRILDSILDRQSR